MDRWVWTNRFSATAPDYRHVGSKSGYLDPPSPVSAHRLRDLLVNWELFKAYRNDIADADDLVPCTWGAQEGRMMLWNPFGIRIFDKCIVYARSCVVTRENRESDTYNVLYVGLICRGCYGLFEFTFQLEHEFERGKRSGVES